MYLLLIFGILVTHIAFQLLCPKLFFGLKYAIPCVNENPEATCMYHPLPRAFFSTVCWIMFTSMHSLYQMRGQVLTPSGSFLLVWVHPLCALHKQNNWSVANSFQEHFNTYIGCKIAACQVPYAGQNGEMARQKIFRWAKWKGKLQAKILLDCQNKFWWLSNFFPYFVPSNRPPHEHNRSTWSHYTVIYNSITQ